MRGDDRKGLGRSSQGLTLNVGLSTKKNAAVRSRLRNQEISERKQVGDAESMMNEERPARAEAANSFADHL